MEFLEKTELIVNLLHQFEKKESRKKIVIAIDCNRKDSVEKFFSELKWKIGCGRYKECFSSLSSQSIGMGQKMNNHYYIQWYESVGMKRNLSNLDKIDERMIVLSAFSL